MLGKGLLQRALGGFSCRLVRGRSRLGWAEKCQCVAFCFQKCNAHQTAGTESRSFNSLLVRNSYDHSVAQFVSLTSVSVTQLTHNKKQPITVSCDIILQSCCLLLFALLLVVHHSFFDLLHYYYTISDYYT